MTYACVLNQATRCLRSQSKVADTVHVTGLDNSFFRRFCIAGSTLRLYSQKLQCGIKFVEMSTGICGSRWTRFKGAIKVSVMLMFPVDK